MGQIIAIGDGGTGTAENIETVANAAALPAFSASNIGAVRVTLDDGHFWEQDISGWVDISGGGGGGGVTNGANVGGGSGIFKTLAGSILDFKSLVAGANIAITANANDLTLDVPNPTYAQINAALGLPANCFMFSDATSQVVGYGEWGINPTTKFSNAQIFYQPNNLGVGPQAFNWNVNIDPLQNSPNDSLTVFNVSANLDSSATGFNMGTAGNAVTIWNAGFNAQGNGSTYGRLVYQNWFTGFGNGTDPFTFKGLSGINIGWNAAANVTVDGQYSAYSSNVTMDAAAISTSNFAVNGFSETSQLTTANVYGYNGFFCQPNIGTIKNTHNFNGLTISPTITNFEGNAGFFGAIIGGAITNQSASNGYFGLQVNPTITHLTQNSSGISVNTTTTDGTADWSSCFLSSNNIVTTGNVRVLNIVTPNGSSHSAIDSTGHHFLNVGVNLANGLGQANGNVIGGQVTIPNGTAITTTDFFGNNLAFGINLGDGTSSFTSSSPVGLSAVGFVGQVIGDGDADLINFLINGYAPAFNGHVTRINNTHNACFPNSGTGTLDESVLMLVSQPGGPVGTDNWGFRAENDHLENYMPRLAIGTSNKKVSSSIIGIDSAKTVQTIVATTDAGNSAGIFNSSSHTTVDGSNTTIGINGVASGVIDVGATNDKTVCGMNFVVGRQSGTDDGTLQNMTGANVLVFNQSGAGGVTVEEVGYDLTTFAFSGTVTDLYDFRSTHVPAGGTVTNHYGIYIKPGAAPKKNWLSGQTVIGGSSATPTNSDSGLEIKTGTLIVSSYDNAGEAAITAINGMVIYNTDLNKFRGYENGAWVNLV